MLTVAVVVAIACSTRGVNAVDNAMSEEQLKAAAKASDEQEIQDKQLCEACHAFVDSFYMALNREFEERKKRGKSHHKILEIDVFTPPLPRPPPVIMRVAHSHVLL